MTVAELIEALQALPADLVVVMPSWEHEDLCTPIEVLQDTAWRDGETYQLADERDGAELLPVARLFERIPDPESS